MRNPPLSLYIHIPWCVQKCPYCDFNSHAQKEALPEREYIAHLLDDLSNDLALTGDRPIETIFIGGGTPSLFSAEAMHALLTGVRQRANLTADAEITMEANPGTFEAERFAGFVDAGINRMSLGVQSFNNAQLKHLGRIHDAMQAHHAIGHANKVTRGSCNIDLMHGLPDQSVEDALEDLAQAIEHDTSHLSWYQLTIEPNTPFYSRPPELPDDDVLWDIQQQGHALLAKAGFEQYEISAYAKAGKQCRHNLNYWRFGDYIGIGCGAHGKITDAQNGSIKRTVKVKHPRGYMELARPYLDQQNEVAPEDRPFEFFINRLRLVEPCPIDDFEALTGTAIDTNTQHQLERAAQQGLLEITENTWQVTAQGRRYLNSLLSELA